MYSGTNIILVTNNESIVELLGSQLVQLRNIDSILIRNYKEALQSIKEEYPQVIILSCQNSVDEAFCPDLIKRIKEISDAPIILLVEKYNTLFVKQAYKIGINDVLSSDYCNNEILMRTIWSLQKNDLKQQVQKYTKLLVQLNVIDKLTGFYNEKFCEKIFENEINTLKDKNQDGIFIALEPNENSRLRPSLENLVDTIKRNTRTTDTISLTSCNNRFYILLANTNLEGAMIVWNRLNKNIGATEALCGCIYNIDDLPFQKIEKFLKEGLIKAQLSPNLLYIYDETEKNDYNWLNTENIPQQNFSKDFKLFRNMFSKKLENIIKPSITELLEEYENLLTNTDLPIVETNNSFAVKFVNKRQESEFKIVQESNLIKIESIHNGLDSPENRTATLNLSDISKKEIQNEFENFILEFKSCF